MIARVWTTGVAPSREDEYLEFARTRSGVMFLSQPGCLGVLFLKLPDGRHSACSFWTDRAAVDALARSGSYRATAADLAASGALLGEPTVQILEVEGGALDLGRWARASASASISLVGL